MNTIVKKWKGKRASMDLLEKSGRPVYVVGHKNPDTDSICSAIAYAHLKNACGGDGEYIPARAGQINLPHCQD